uniref:Uncharacterized protein n=1 Tax=Picea sitchensis TaxID=3332 RepID=A9NKX5_PICSI|nr:unknown [Picea sitchensis]
MAGSSHHICRAISLELGNSRYGVHGRENSVSRPPLLEKLQADNQITCIEFSCLALEALTTFKEGCHNRRQQRW